MENMAVVIIPAFQPDKTLIAITDQLWSMGCRMIVVDDGSGKEYQQIFEAINDVAIILHHSENRGKGAAIKTALTYIKNEMWDNDVIGVMDADGQHSTQDMRKVLECAMKYKKTFVLGVRTFGKETPWKSRIGNGVTRKVFQLFSGVAVSDTQTGLRAFGMDLIEKLLLVKGERYEYEMNVLLKVAREKIPIIEVPIETIYHDKNNSCSHFHVVRDSIRIYADLLKFTLSSLSSFILDYLLFVLLIKIFPQKALFVILANICARIVSAFYNYSVNCRVVFHTDRKRTTAAAYFVLAACVLGMNNLILNGFIQSFHFSAYPAKLCTEVLLFFISWLVQKQVIFKKRICFERQGEHAKDMPV